MFHLSLQLTSINFVYYREHICSEWGIWDTIWGRISHSRRVCFLSGASLWFYVENTNTAMRILDTLRCNSGSSFESLVPIHMPTCCSPALYLFPLIIRYTLGERLEQRGQMNLIMMVCARHLHSNTSIRDTFGVPPRPELSTYLRIMVRCYWIFPCFFFFFLSSNTLSGRLLTNDINTMPSRVGCWLGRHGPQQESSWH